MVKARIWIVLGVAGVLAACSKGSDSVTQAPPPPMPTATAPVSPPTAAPVPAAALPPPIAPASPPVASAVTAGEDTAAPAAETPAVAEPIMSPMQALPGTTPAESHSEGITVTGTVIETILVGTSKTMYLRLDVAGKEVWVASKEIEVKQGDRVKASEGMEMQHFTSKMLNRTFDTLIMASEIEKLP